ncbi:MAG: DUF192 domain-containing protein [Planctomycetota bacterium]
MASWWMRMGRSAVPMTLCASIALVAAMPGCDEQTATGVESVKLDGQWFHLELVADPATRVKGLGGRDYIAPDGGMLFAFPSSQVLQFVMRDCLVPIDVIFLDPSGRILAMHQMPIEEPEPPQAEGESDEDYRSRRIQYELSLPKYTSRYSAQFAIELAGGTLEGLDLEVGQKVDLDVERLKTLAK